MAGEKYVKIAAAAGSGFEGKPWVGFQQQSRGTFTVKPTATIVIPAYNEQEGLGIVLERIFKAIDGRCEVIVVDDGSGDRTPEVASRFPCQLIRHETNRGKGEALKTGIRHAKGESVIFIDADASYPAEVIPQMTEALKLYDMVYGSRTTGRRNIPRSNRMGSMVLQRLIRYIYGFKPHDYCTGLYGVKRCHLSMMNLSSSGFAIEPEIAIKGSRMRLQAQDIPIRYHPRVGQTKLNSLKAGLEHLNTVLSLILWRPSNGKP